MSGKLDQSLDDILKTSRRSAPKGARGRGGRRVGHPGRPAAAVAPVGGVKKTGKKAVVKSVPTGPSGSGESKIQVSGLPRDVTEKLLKEYFHTIGGPVKRAEISYGPDGASRGVGTVTFVRSDSAGKAAKVDGLVVDGRFKMKVEVILDAKRASTLPAPKGLGDRISAPKVHPKSAIPAKNGAASTREKTRGAKKARSARPAKKTAEELDSEMADYWESGVNGAGATAATDAAPANGDATMDEEIL